MNKTGRPKQRARWDHGYGTSAEVGSDVGRGVGSGGGQGRMAALVGAGQVGPAVLARAVEAVQSEVPSHKELAVKTRKIRDAYKNNDREQGMALLKAYVERGFLNKPAVKKNPVVFEVVRYADLEALKYVVKEGAELDVQNCYNLNSLLHIAIKRNLYDVEYLKRIEFLLESGAPTHLPNVHGFLPMHEVLTHKEDQKQLGKISRVVDLLIEHDTRGDPKLDGDCILKRIGERTVTIKETAWRLGVAERVVRGFDLERDVELIKRTMEEADTKLAKNEQLIEMAREIREAYQRGDSDEGLDLLKYYVEEKGFINERIHNSSTILVHMVEYGDVEAIKYLVEQGARVDVRHHYTHTIRHSLLHIAIRRSLLDPEYVERIEFLLSRGAPTDIANSNGFLPMHQTLMSKGSSKSLAKIRSVVDLLIEHDTREDPKLDGDCILKRIGERVITVRYRAKELGVAERVVRGYEPVDNVGLSSRRMEAGEKKRPTYKEIAIMIRAIRKAYEIGDRAKGWELLQKYVADGFVNMGHSTFDPILMQLIRHGDMHAIEYVVEQGARVDVIQKDRKDSLLHLAIRRPYKHADYVRRIQFLIDRGAPVDRLNYRGWRLLHEILDKNPTNESEWEKLDAVIDLLMANDHSGNFRLDGNEILKQVRGNRSLTVGEKASRLGIADKVLKKDDELLRAVQVLMGIMAGHSGDLREGLRPGDTVGANKRTAQSERSEGAKRQKRE